MRIGALALVLIASIACMGAGPGDLNAMRFLLGTWTCSGEAMDGTQFHVTETTKLSADGSRLVTHDSSGKVSTELYYDAARKLWVRTSVNGKDGSNSSETSPGWAGSTLILTGQINITGMQSLESRSTMTKVSPSKTTQVDELQAPTGWMQFDTSTCEKT